MLENRRRSIDSTDSNQFPNEDNNDFRNSEELREFLLHVTRIWNQLKFLGSHILDNVARRSAKRPFLALGVSVGALAIALPSFIVVSFALFTVVITYTGFILIEGTLVTIASILLFGCLGAILIVFMFFGGLTLAGYFGFMHIYDLFSGLHNKSALMDFLNKERNISETSTNK